LLTQEIYFKISYENIVWDVEVVVQGSLTAVKAMAVAARVAVTG
jgi:hypothetical protein